MRVYASHECRSRAGDERSASGTSLKGLENALNASKRALERADKAFADACAIRDEAQQGLDEAAAVQQVCCHLRGSKIRPASALW